MNQNYWNNSYSNNTWLFNWIIAWNKTKSWTFGVTKENKWNKVVGFVPLFYRSSKDFTYKSSSGLNANEGLGGIQVISNNFKILKIRSLSQGFSTNFWFVWSFMI